MCRCTLFYTHGLYTHHHRSCDLHRQALYSWLRFPVARLLGLMAAGETRETILKTYPYIESGDIDEALRYAALPS
ncbi:MAG TPA: DUF433 domain-containing protein [Steroidobacteraceae bacterium]